MAAAAVEAAAAEAREILKTTKYHGQSFQRLIVFHEILKTAPRRSHAIHFRFGSKSGSCRWRSPPCQLVVQGYPYYIRSDFKVGFFFNKFMEKAGQQWKSYFKPLR